MGPGRIRSIAIYGRNGVGKTVVSANLSAALSRAGYRVLLIGCGCKANSYIHPSGFGSFPTLLGLMQKHPATSPADAVQLAFGGVFRLEIGSPECAAAGPSIMAAIQRISDSGLFEELELDFIVYNVQGDEAGGGFTVPIRTRFFQSIFTVMSAELKSVRAANSLFEQIRQHAGDGGARAGGIIANFIDAPYSRSLIDEYAEMTTMQVLEYLPRSNQLDDGELRGKSIFEAYPHSQLADTFGKLALKIATGTVPRLPDPLAPEALWRFSSKWNTRFVEMQTGEGSGACI